MKERVLHSIMVLALVLGMVPLMATPVMAQTTNSLVQTIGVNPLTTYSDGTLEYEVTLYNLDVPGAHNVTVDIYFYPPGPTGAAGAYGLPVLLDAAKTINVGQTVTYNSTGGGGALARPTLAVDLGAIPLNLGVTVVYAASEFDGDYIYTPPYEAYDIRNVPATIIYPNTAVTIAASAAKVMSGGTVTLNVTEDNSGDDPLSNPYVEIWKGTATPTTFVANLTKSSTYYDSGDTNGNGILDTTETWKWVNVPSGAITAAIKFFALGFGTDSLGNKVSYATGYTGERAEVTVNTIQPDTVVAIVASATKVVSGGSVTLNVTEDNTGDDPLSNPYVEIWKGTATPTTFVVNLTKSSTYYDSGDTNGNGILDTTETWKWVNIPSGAITAAIKFFALGFGTDSLGNQISYATGHTGERAEVTVNTVTPDTAVTITSSAAWVVSGGSVTLNVTEDNTGGDPLSNPYVEIWKGTATPTTFVANLTKSSTYYDSGDTNGNGILDTTETWKWVNIPSGAITAAIKFFALGFGTDSLGNQISYATGHTGERAEVRVDVRGEGCLQICKFQDTNVNAMWDPGEPWLPDWRFHVTGPDGYDTWLVTGPEGCVLISGLVSGTYTVTEELEAGWYNTRPGGPPPYEQEVIVEVGKDCARVEFGNREEIKDVPPMIPTMNQWGIIAMIAVFAGLLVWTVRRKRLAS